MDGYRQVSSNIPEKKRSGRINSFSQSRLSDTCSTLSGRKKPVLYYRPDRVARQFGLDQATPLSISLPNWYVQEYNYFQKSSTYSVIYKPGESRSGQTTPEYFTFGCWNCSRALNITRLIRRGKERGKKNKFE